MALVGGKKAYFCCAVLVVLVNTTLCDDMKTMLFSIQFELVTSI